MEEIDSLLFTFVLKNLIFQFLIHTISKNSLCFYYEVMKKL